MLFNEGTVVNGLLLLGPTTIQVEFPQEQGSFDSHERHTKLELKSNYFKHGEN